MPLGNDPTPLAELEAGFGVAANASELIKANSESRSEEQRALQLKRVNDDLTNQVRDDFGKLESHLGDDVEVDPENVTVRGSGASAIIQYVYVGPRGSNEKGYVPFAEVHGSAAAKRRRRAMEVERTTPDEAAQKAAAERERQAEREAAEAQAEHEAKVEEILADARAKAEEELAKAREEADKIRADAAEEAQKAADKARSDTEKAKAKQSGK